MTYVLMISGVERATDIAAFVCCQGVGDAETHLVVDKITVVFVALIDEMVLPQRVDEEGLHDFLRAAGNGVDRIHQVGIVHHHL